MVRVRVSGRGRVRLGVRNRVRHRVRVRVRVRVTFQTVNLVCKGSVIPCLVWRGVNGVTVVRKRDGSNVLREKESDDFDCGCGGGSDEDGGGEGGAGGRLSLFLETPEDHCLCYRLRASSSVLQAL